MRKLSVVLVARENMVADGLRTGAITCMQMVRAARDAGKDIQPGDAHDQKDASPSPETPAPVGEDEMVMNKMLR